MAKKTGKKTGKKAVKKATKTMPKASKKVREALTGPKAIEKRLGTLRGELQKGVNMIAGFRQQLATTENKIQQIQGAIKVLEEMKDGFRSE